MTTRLFAMVMVCILTSPIVRGEGPKDDHQAMPGTWLLVTAELAGTKLPEESLKIMKLILTDQTYELQTGEESDKGTYKLDSAKKPREMDIKGTEGPNKGKTILTIYELQDDTLKVCYDLGGKDRPTEFKTNPNTQLFLVTYKREKR